MAKAIHPARDFAGRSWALTFATSSSLTQEANPPASSTLRVQQRRFEAFRIRYNDERPHEVIGDRTPSSL